MEMIAAILHLTLLFFVMIVLRVEKGMEYRARRDAKSGQLQQGSPRMITLSSEVF